ncbi:MAG TPA: molybdopterin cofactor-binding domain-containing protein, partial [Thermoanaerobaculia bacterium]
MADPEALLRELSEHELAGRLHWFEVDRRRFLRALGGGLLVCAAAPALPMPVQESGRSSGSPETTRDLAAWIHIGSDSRVTVFTGKVEIGQNIRTSLAQQVAEELH